MTHFVLILWQILPKLLTKSPFVIKINGNLMGMCLVMVYQNVRASVCDANLTFNFQNNIIILEIL